MKHAFAILIWVTSFAFSETTTSSGSLPGSTSPPNYMLEGKINVDVSLPILNETHAPGLHKGPNFYAIPSTSSRLPGLGDVIYSIQRANDLRLTVPLNPATAQYNPCNKTGLSFPWDTSIYVNGTTFAFTEHYAKPNPFKPGVYVKVANTYVQEYGQKIASFANSRYQLLPAETNPILNFGAVNARGIMPLMRVDQGFGPVKKAVTILRDQNQCPTEYKLQFQSAKRSWEHVVTLTRDAYSQLVSFHAVIHRSDGSILYDYTVSVNSDNLNRLSSLSLTNHAVTDPLADRTLLAFGYDPNLLPPDPRHIIPVQISNDTATWRYEIAGKDAPFNVQNTSTTVFALKWGGGTTTSDPYYEINWDPATREVVHRAPSGKTFFEGYNYLKGVIDPATGFLNNLSAIHFPLPDGTNRIINSVQIVRDVEGRRTNLPRLREFLVYGFQVGQQIFSNGMIDKYAYFIADFYDRFGRNRQTRNGTGLDMTYDFWTGASPLLGGIIGWAQSFVRHTTLNLVTRDTYASYPGLVNGKAFSSVTNLVYANTGHTTSSSTKTAGSEELRWTHSGMTIPKFRNNFSDTDYNIWQSPTQINAGEADYIFTRNTGDDVMKVEQTPYVGPAEKFTVEYVRDSTTGKATQKISTGPNGLPVIEPLN